MSSRNDYRRRDRSWEREERERDRVRPRYRNAPRSRSRSPRRDDRDRRPSDRRDYGRGRDDDRRERDGRDDRRRDDRDRDARARGAPRDREHDRERERERESERGKEKDSRDLGRGPEHPTKHEESRSVTKPDGMREESRLETPDRRHESEARTDEGEEGEAMDVMNDDEAAMMAMMGLPMSGFGSTKGKRVEGNQEGAVNVKKMRTWRQYMNRRGGFNRPLDKIK
ncbi:hypothetical protein CERSUDRAFT_64634 [Gelatoporia subvermispora B]|uniref:U4/U6.U5 small nuclear ribonucleoprotein 27kDa protein domain-containing protein n=1 Tax=Ceriporiopsis subvermispora (strain B) TaxID=914234 RepID=M2QMW9_CERS8|nr:hypothetical protein CERSUDRAFT_64634 [Gelatoporia subvermispora B]